MAEARGRVLDVGNCNPDHHMIRMMIDRHFLADVDRVMFVEDALQHLRETRYDLVLFNRLIFEDQTEGLELVRRARADASLNAPPMMMISNYDDAQKAAVDAGAEPGFGKSKLFDATTIDNIARFLPRK